MKLGEGKGIKTSRWLVNEILHADDINFLSQSRYQLATDIFAMLMEQGKATGSTADLVISGLMLEHDTLLTCNLLTGAAVSYKGAYFNSDVWGFVASAGKIFLAVVADDSAVAFDPGGASDRIDTVEIRPTQVKYSSILRKFKDPVTGQITSSPVDTRYDYAFEFQILKGTEGAGVAPTHTAGWIKVAEVEVAASATSIVQADIKDVRDSDVWTTEANYTKYQNPFVGEKVTSSPTGGTATSLDKESTIKEALDEIFARLLNLSGVQNDAVVNRHIGTNAVRQDQVDLGVDVGDVDADVLPLGTVVTSSPTGGTNTNLANSTFVRAALQEILNRLKDLSGVQNNAVLDRHVGDDQLDSRHYKADSIDEEHLNLGSAAGQIDALTIPSPDTNSRYTAAHVEGQLQEIAGSGRTIETVKGNADNIAAVPCVKRINQTIDSGVSVKDCVYYDTGDSKWKKAGKWKVPPQGIYIGSNTVLLFGYISGLTGLTAGKVYWMTGVGLLTSNIDFAYKATRVAYALSTTELIFQVWLEQNYDSEVSTFGFFGGGNTGSLSNVIDYIDTTIISGNAIDRGDLTVAKAQLAGVSGPQYGFYGGGYTTVRINVIEYIDMTLTTGNAVDRGDLTVARNFLAGVSGPQYGFFGGGTTGSVTNIIDYIDMFLTVGNAVDRGDLTAARVVIAGVSGPQYGFFGGGDTGSLSNVIDYIDTTIISGNAIDRGDLSAVRDALAGVSGPQYGFFGGGDATGSPFDIIEYIDMTLTTGNAVDRGDLTVARNTLAGVSGPQYGFFGGGRTTVIVDIIDYIDMTILTGNAVDRGDLTAVKRYLAGIA